MRVAVVIPSFKVSSTILQLIDQIGPEVQDIFVVDDACPEKSGQIVVMHSTDSRVKVIFHDKNLGVGGAVKTGYLEALKCGCEVVVKIDGDGQMNPKLIKKFIEPIVQNRADYVKGNRFNNFSHLKQMPKIRIIGNLILSFFTKFSSGYWNIFDPTNGFTAIRTSKFPELNFQKMSNRYFFESDILFHLYLSRAVVLDVPMEAIYGQEKSNLRILRVIPEFGFKHFRNYSKRILLTYLIRDFNFASIQLVVGLSLSSIGTVIGFRNWIVSAQNQTATPTGTLILVTLLLILGFQLILGFLSHDSTNIPNEIRGKYDEQD